MPNQTKSVSSTQPYHPALIFLIYALLAAAFGLAYRYAINPDGTSMLRLAGYIAEGNFFQSVSPGYSPLFTWLIAPFIFIGLEGQAAARVTIALCGAGLLACSWFLTARFELSGNIRLAAMLIAALLTSLWTVQFISPDVLFAALILCYLYKVTDPDILAGWKVPFLSGIAGGFAYLAHHYALPFFFAHFPVMLMVRGISGRQGTGLPWRRLMISLISGVAGFLIIASIWVGIVSAKNGQFTFSTKGGAAHSIMGPKDIDRRHPFFVGGLFKPKDGYAIHIFEDPSEVEFKTWSPFESREYFVHQLKVIKINTVYILNHFVNNSPFFTYAFVIGVLAFIPVALLLNRMNRKKKFLYSWVVMTFCVYCSGFMLLIARSPRRFYALMIIFLLISFHFMEELKQALRDIVPERKRVYLSVFLLLMVVCAFAIKPSIKLLKSVKHVASVEQVNPYREMAGQVNAVDFPAPYAVIRTSQKPTTDYYMAYFLNKPLLGRPLSQDPDGIERELLSAGGRSVLVFDDPEMTEALKLDERYSHLASLKLNGGERYSNALGWVIVEHEMISGWDEEVDIFTLK